MLNSREERVFDLRIADFGLAKQLHQGEILSQKCGSPTYIAPEILRGGGYSFSADLFSVGSIMFNLASGNYLFQGKDVNDLIEKNKICNLSDIDSLIPHLSKDGKDLIRKLLDTDPYKRPTAEEAL